MQSEFKSVWSETPSLAYEPICILVWKFLSDRICWKEFWIFDESFLLPSELTDEQFKRQRLSVLCWLSWISWCINIEFFYYTNKKVAVNLLFRIAKIWNNHSKICVCLSVCVCRNLFLSREIQHIAGVCKKLNQESQIIFQS
jgi:hypothetical protein